MRLRLITIQQFGIDVGSTRNARVFFIDTDESRDAVQSIAQNLLADPVVEVAQLIDTPADDDGCSLTADDAGALEASLADEAGALEVAELASLLAAELAGAELELISLAEDAGALELASLAGALELASLAGALDAASLELASPEDAGALEDADEASSLEAAEEGWPSCWAA